MLNPSIVLSYLFILHRIPRRPDTFKLNHVMVLSCFFGWLVLHHAPLSMVCRSPMLGSVVVVSMSVDWPVEAHQEVADHLALSRCAVVSRVSAKCAR